MKNSIGRYDIRNKAQLWEIIQNDWLAISTERCGKLVESVLRRCVAVINKKGKQPSIRMLRELQAKWNHFSQQI